MAFGLASVTASDLADTAADVFLATFFAAALGFFTGVVAEASSVVVAATFRARVIFAGFATSVDTLAGSAATFGFRGARGFRTGADSLFSLTFCFTDPCVSGLATSDLGLATDVGLSTDTDCVWTVAGACCTGAGVVEGV